ncbi:MAG: hypothetical protein AAFP70_19015 [Calditrichota bacterium]
MFDVTSRYYNIPNATFTNSNGKEVVYKRRRICPPAESLVIAFRFEVKEEDRLDLIAAQTLGAPTLFWRICDANNALVPETLTEVPGKSLLIPRPQL